MKNIVRQYYLTDYLYQYITDCILFVHIRISSSVSLIMFKQFAGVEIKASLRYNDANAPLWDVSSLIPQSFIFIRCLISASRSIFRLEPVRTCFASMKEKERGEKVRRPGTERQRDRVGTTPYGSQDLNSKTWD